jgi:hypothetical protein
MKTCTQCTNNETGICSQYDKAPPPGFAERCRFFSPGAVITEPERIACEQCNRFDRDDTGDWCLYSDEGQIVCFVKLPMEQKCPLT